MQERREEREQRPCPSRLKLNNDSRQNAEAEHVGILAAEIYFPAQYVSIFAKLYR